MSKLICTFEGSSRYVEYTSDNGCKGILEGSRMVIMNPKGITMLKSPPSVKGNIKMLIDITDDLPEAFNEFLEDLYDGKSAASDV